MILLSAGHYPDSKGATYRRFNEHDEAVLWVDLLAYNLREKTEVLIVPTGRIKHKVAWSNRWQADLFVEIHFNASASGEGKGSTTLYYPGSVKGKKAANIVQHVLGKRFPPDHGVRPGYYRGDPKRGPLAVLKDTNCPALILEPEFVYQYDDIRAKRVIACQELSGALLEASYG